MNSAKKRVVIIIIIAFVCSMYLSSFARREKNHVEGASTGAYTWLANMLNLQQIAVGFLWTKFNYDSINFLANYHRQLITLDAITVLDSSDYEAWSLKNFMRLDQSRGRDNDMKRRAVRDFSLACKLNPNDWRYRQDAAEALFFKGKEGKLSLKYLRAAKKFPEHDIRTEKLLSHILKLEGNYEEALELQNEILRKTTITEVDRNTATRKIIEIKQLMKDSAK